MPYWLKRARHNLEQGKDIQIEHEEDHEAEDVLSGVPDLFQQKPVPGMQTTTVVSQSNSEPITVGSSTDAGTSVGTQDEPFSDGDSVELLRSGSQNSPETTSPQLQYTWVQCDHPDCGKWRKIEKTYASRIDMEPFIDGSDFNTRTVH